MSKASAKKLNLALYLNPETSEADRYAVGVLSHWYNKAKASHDHNQDLEMVVRLFHRDIYLAGLYLHRLDPSLCKAVAAALSQDQVTPVGLQQLLQAYGLGAPVEPQTGSGSGFTPAQLQQLQQLLGTNAATPVESELSQQLASQNAKLEQLLAGQVAPAAPVDGDWPALLARQSEQLQQLQQAMAELRQLATEQANQLKRLRAGQPAGNEAAAPLSSPEREETQVTEIAPHLAQIQQIKKKGLF